MTFSVRLRAGEVEVERLAGADPPLVYLHEGLGSLGLWRGFPAQVAERTGRAAVVWSRHGYGRSAPAALPRQPDYMHREALDVLPELLETLEVERPVLVGHSDGASIALIYAGCAGSGVSAIVALAPHVMVEPRSVDSIAAAREEFRHSDLAGRLARHHDDAAATFWGWNDIWLSPAFRDWNIEGYLPGITCPTLLVQCRDDRYGTLEQLDRVSAAVSGPVTRLVFEDGGHSPHLAHPDETATAVARFLAEHSEWSVDGQPP